ncbi:hypothetical protein AFLA_005910 [Aspergillus flavus NRRL3357]|nr:hypothetical protein AFLA_005910 [Aspergillus flavus NRRL3357]
MWLHEKGAVDVTRATHGLAMTGAFGIHGTQALRAFSVKSAFPITHAAHINTSAQRNKGKSVQIRLLGGRIAGHFCARYLED